MVALREQRQIWRQKLNRERERPYWLAFSFFEGIGPQRFQQLLAYFQSAEKAWRAEKKELLVAGLSPRLAEKFLLFRRWWSPEKIKWQEQQFYYRPEIYREFARWLADQERRGQWRWVTRRQAYGQKPAWITMLSWLDDGYPVPLLDLETAPPVLYFLGRPEVLRPEFWQRPLVAIVGTRKVTPYGQQVTRQLAAGLARTGVVVVSGLARGVDSLAHQAALDAQGWTLAILGNGVDIVYPAENGQLGAAIQQRGGLFSEFPPGFPPLPGNFPARNRIIAGLSRLVVVTEAAEKSGSLITARLAADQGKDVLAVPGPITSSLSQGTSLLLKQGAKLVTTVADILQELNLPAVATPKVDLDQLSPEEKAIYQALAAGEKYLDELVRATDLPASRLGSILSIMAVKGLVADLGSGRWGRK